MLNLTASSVCPGLFYGVSAQDGMLARIRIPGGILNYNQCDFLAKIADQYATGYLQVTNRANLQIRGIHQDIPIVDLQTFQSLQLGAKIFELDALRNIMISPTAGIDCQALIDTRPFVKEIDHYLQTHPELSLLSPKFSIGINGGETTSIRDRYNDILLVARSQTTNSVVDFQLFLNRQDTGLCITPNQILDVVAAIAQVYRQFCQENPLSSNQPRYRLRQILGIWGMQEYLHRVKAQLKFTCQKLSPQESENDLMSVNSHVNTSNNHHIGIHPQPEPGLVYIGLVLPLGRLETWQLRGLMAIAQCYSPKNDNDETLRITPWQNVIIPNLPQTLVPDIIKQLQALNLDWHFDNAWNGLIACSGTQGCISSHIPTHIQASTLAKNLPRLNPPVKIHISGCEKGCASQGDSDITLVGMAENKYQVLIATNLVNPNSFGEKDTHYKNKTNQKFGRELYTNISSSQTNQIIQKIVTIYQNYHRDRETFREFVNRYQVDELRQLIGNG